eukprot:TRINITY_DN67136_c0_g1_i1.p2 TRINITY_DN67136_c0_g1~~TRINITY_DN67136_c0_g1_i1.p2  ORF type:complete len:176 (+),score=18.91 TRINITY_DN67136_c0_g1_i1:96-623(+)
MERIPTKHVVAWLLALAATPASSSVEPCRSPTEQDYACLKCCDDTPEGCQYGTWTCGRSTEESWCKGEPWYNSHGLERGVKCADIKEEIKTRANGKNVTSYACGPPCSPCDKRTERDFLQLEPPAGCKCTEASLKTVDACFHPHGCDCYCQKYERGIKACPHLRTFRTDDPKNEL